MESRSNSSSPTSIRERVHYAFGSLVAVLLPFLFVEILPVADLAQHVAQVRIALEHTTSESSLYVMQWWTPYTLAALVTGIFWPVGDAFLTGKLAMMFMAGGWVLAMHLLALRFRVHPFAALLTSFLALNTSFYWGFAAFYVGFIPFAVWIVLVDVTLCRAPTTRHYVAAFFCALLLYMSHVFWLAAGLGVLGVEFLRSRSMSLVKLGATTLPLWGLVAWWYPTLSERQFQSEILWHTFPTERLSIDWLASMGFGPLAYASTAALAVLILFLGLRLRSRPPIDWRLFFPGLLLLGFALLLPHKMQLTIVMSGRWLAPALVLISLALFGERPPARRLVTAGIAAMCAISLSITFLWVHFESTELDGLAESVRAVEKDSPRTLGLDFKRQSETLKGSIQPFLQMHAWVQAEHGGLVNFSFAEMAPLPMVFVDRSHITWTRNLEWYPNLVRPEDVEQFDYLLVNTSERGHTNIAKAFGVEPLVDETSWQIYRVRSGAP